MKLISGNALTPTQREQAGDLYWNRWRVIGRERTYRNEDAWFDGHAFWAYDDGRLAMNVSAEPGYISESAYDLDYIGSIESISFPYMTHQEMIEEVITWRAFAKEWEVNGG